MAQLATVTAPCATGVGVVVQGGTPRLDAVVGGFGMQIHIHSRGTQAAEEAKEVTI